MRPFDPRLLKYARSARKPIIITGLIGTLIAIAVITQSLLISAALSPVITGNARLSDVAGFVVALVIVIIIRGLLVGLRDSLGQRAADSAIRDLRCEVLHATEELGPRWRAVHGADTTTLLTRGLDDLGPYFVKFLPQLVLTMTATPLALAIMLYLDAWSGVIALFVIPLIPVFMALIGRFTQDSSKAKLVAMERLGSQLLDLMAGLPTLRSLGRENGPRAHLEALGKENTRTTMATLRVAFLSGAALEFLSTLSVALVAVEVGMRLVAGNVTLFTGLAVIMLAPEVFEPLRQVGAQFHASANGVAAAQSAFEIIETERPQASRTVSPLVSSPSNEATLTTSTSSPNSGADGDSTSPVSLRQAPPISSCTIELENLSVAARGTWAPHNLSASIQPGQLTVLEGASGAGKSTTVLTILNLLTPTKGSVVLAPLDGATPSCDVSDCDANSWWKQITWVPQAPTILPGTLLENMALKTVTSGLVEAAQATGFHTIVEAMPDGWDSKVGVGGIGLSVGQRQRLALTRALVNDSPLVILDEPTAHLDAVSEEEITRAIRALKSQGKTVLVIAHRQALKTIADLVILVESAPATIQDIEEYPQLGVNDWAQTSVDVDLPGILTVSATDTDLEKAVN